MTRARNHILGCPALGASVECSCPWVEHVKLEDFQAPPVPLLLWCPLCATRHVDSGRFATQPHHTHACQACGLSWRPALVNTVGVQFLPGFKDPS